MENENKFQFIVDFNERPIGIFIDPLPIRFLMEPDQSE